MRFLISLLIVLVASSFMGCSNQDKENAEAFRVEVQVNTEAVFHYTANYSDYNALEKLSDLEKQLDSLNLLRAQGLLDVPETTGLRVRIRDERIKIEQNMFFGAIHKAHSFSTDYEDNGLRFRTAWGYAKEYAEEFKMDLRGRCEIFHFDYDWFMMLESIYLDTTFPTAYLRPDSVVGVRLNEDQFVFVRMFPGRPPCLYFFKTSDSTWENLPDEEYAYEEKSLSLSSAIPLLRHAAKIKTPFGPLVEFWQRKAASIAVIDRDLTGHGIVTDSTLPKSSWSDTDNMLSPKNLIED